MLKVEVRRTENLNYLCGRYYKLKVVKIKTSKEFFLFLFYSQPFAPSRFWLMEGRKDYEDSLKARSAGFASLVC